MHLLLLPILHVMLTFFSVDPAPSLAKNAKSNAGNATPISNVVAGETNLIYQSKDGGQTWQDISSTLPEYELPVDFFASDNDVYLRLNDRMYHSKANLKIPVWEKENNLDPQCGWIAFNRAGVMAYGWEGQFYQKMAPAGVGAWSPVYPTLKKQLVQTVFETLDGTVFVGCENGLYKSADKGQTWKQVVRNGWVMELVESKGVLIGTSQGGIMRSTDNGEHWEWVINEGGVGIDVERIDGGFAAVSFNTHTKSRRIHTSFDGGKTWKAIDEGLQPSEFISSIKQVGSYLVCGHPDGIFRSSDMGKTWNKVHDGVDNAMTASTQLWDGTSNDNRRVFKLYVSGNVLYAVANSGGC